MKRTLFVSLTVLATAGASPWGPQQAPSRAEQAILEREGFLLQQNFPNPFNPETDIPFTLHEQMFEERPSAVVTMRIYNVLASYVASPVALGHPAGENVRLDQLEYTRSGLYLAHWDGRDQSGREVASGMYIMQLTVNGRTQTKKVLVAK